MNNWSYCPRGKKDADAEIFASRIAGILSKHNLFATGTTGGDRRSNQFVHSSNIWRAISEANSR